MIRDLYVREVVLFFLFTFSDEDLAIKAATQTLKQCDKKIKTKIEDEFIDHDELISSIVFYSYKYWKKYSLKRTKVSLNLTHNKTWVLPEGLSLDLWKQFLKEADSEEYLSILWVKILNFSEDQIARGLGLTVGTVRHRVNRGLRVLANL